MKLLTAALGLSLVASGSHTALSAKQVSKPVSAAQAAAVTPTKPLTDEDYYVPLDHWLKNHLSPLDGKDFYEVGKQYHLDPDLLIAITKAETNLGRVKQRGSGCNVGSVGSYDSTTTTFACRSYRHGIEEMGQTLDNQALGSYTKVSQLSRAGNCCGPVYATSPVNWQRNVLATLSELKGRPIGPEYQFRK